MMMNSDLTKQAWLAHFFAWIGGVLWALTLFTQEWEVVPHMPMRLGNGQFGFNLIIFAFLVLMGGIIGGYWWRFCCWLGGEWSGVLFIVSLSWFVFSTIAVSGYVSQMVYYVISGLILFGGMIYAFKSKPKDSDSEGPLRVVERRSCGGWLRELRPCNVLFFIFFLLALWTNNLMAALKLDVSTAELVSVIIGRFCFAAFLSVCLLLIAELSMRAMPVRSRWLVWGLLALIPVVVISDTWLSQLYGRSTLELLNSLTATGELDVVKELKGGGFHHISALFVKWALLGGYVLAIGLTCALWFLSKRLKFKMSLSRGLVMLVVFYFLSVGEQFVGKHWKNLTSWQQEYKLYMLNQGLVSPKLGLADFVVEFKDYEFESQGSSVRAKEELPDIYVIMVESMRYDSMDAKTTPFLMDLMKDCQSFDTTWAGSNATHLSWYSMFYSKPAVFWMQDLEAIPDRQNYDGSPVLNELRDMGYSLEIRAVCDLGYKDFGLLNFGNEGNLCDVLEHSVDGNELTKYNIPEREQIVFKRLQDSVRSEAVGGGKFYYTALDSPHYNYYWGNDYEVPYKEYKGDISFPLFPTKDEVRLYHNRYLNAVSWVDFQLKEFCDFLKAEGRYENSIIVITGDHGEEFQEQGGWCHCTSLMPEQTKVPILIKWPSSMGKAPAKKLASHQDVMPSIFAYLGASEESMKTMAGTNLLSKDDGNNHTVMVSTAFANKNGETMMLKRDGYTAYFSWDRPWEPRVPSEMRLERIIDGEGKLMKFKNADLREELKELFPDAFDKYFKSLKEMN